MLESNLALARPIVLGPPITFLGSVSYSAPKTQTVAIPVATQAGDLMLMAMACLSQTPATPVGWTKIVTYYSPVSPSPGQMHFFSKIAVANEPSFTLTQDTTTLMPTILAVYRGASRVVTYGTGSSRNPYNLPALSVSETNSQFISIIADRTPSIPSNPSGQTRRATVMPSTTPFHGMAWSDVAITMVGSTPVYTSSSTGNNQYAGMFISALIR